jgi:PAS domain S-box-containing protein
MRTRLDLFAYALQQTSGYLFLGKAETARPARGTFDLLNKRWKVYRCMTGPLTAPLSMGKPHRDGAEGPRRGADGARGEPAGAVDSSLEVLQLRRLNDLVVRHPPSGVVLLDRSYRIVSLNATARRLLGIREPVTDHDFLHTVRSLAAVREGIDRALRDKAANRIDDVSVEGPSGQARFVTLHIAAVHTEAGVPDSVVVTVLDTTEEVELRREIEAARRQQQQLVEELSATNTRGSSGPTKSCRRPTRSCCSRRRSCRRPTRSSRPPTRSCRPPTRS